MQNQPASAMVFLHYLTTVFENIDEAILLIGIEANEQYRLIIANTAYGHITGRTKDTIGQLIADYVEPEIYQRLKKHFKKVVTSKQEVECTEWFNVPSGRRALEIKLIPIFNTVGQVVQIAAITRNVTELLELRQQVRQLQQTS